MAIATTLQTGDALVIVGLQNDRLTGGAVAVPQAEEIVPILNDYVARFERHQLPIYVVRDWHPDKHRSFVDQGGSLPVHCVRFTRGAEFPSGLELPPGAVTISTGIDADDEAASAFGNPAFEANLRTRRVRRLFVGGMTAEHEVQETARAGLERGYEVMLLHDAIRSRDEKPADGTRAEAELIRRGAVALTRVELCPRNPAASALLTDIFEVTMQHAYFKAGMADTAVFEFEVRELPPGRNFLVAAGLEQVLQFLEELHFTEGEIDWLERSRRFSPEFLQSLRGLRFTGDVHAMPEGTLCFAHEPLIRITAPITQAQLVETRLINLLHYPTLVASKAVRAVLAASGRMLVDVGLRRAHGAEAAVLAARACYLAGFGATSDALGAQQFGIPAAGTMARSFVEAASSEEEAFRSFARVNPEHVVLLIDTYDSEAAAQKVVRLAAELRAEGITIQAVRIESGDLEAHARRVRRVLDAGGLPNVQILASGNLDEFAIQRLVGVGAPIDGFGIGTRLVTSADVPFLDCDYQLQRYDARRRGRRIEAGSSWPGVKQVYRILDSAGRFDCDVVALADEGHEGEPLLRRVVQAGRRLDCGEPLELLRERVARQVKQLPRALRALTPAAVAYPVFMSEKLHACSLETGVFPDRTPAAEVSAPAGIPTNRGRTTPAAADPGVSAA